MLGHSVQKSSESIVAKNTFGLSLLEMGEWSKSSRTHKEFARMFATRTFEEKWKMLRRRRMMTEKKRRVFRTEEPRSGQWFLLTVQEFLTVIMDAMDT